MFMKYKEDIKKNIFRGYDIRGIYPSEIDEDTAYTIGLGFGSHIKNLGKTECVVGHDNRLSSPSLYDALIEGITETGINVISLGNTSVLVIFANTIYVWRKRKHSFRY